MPPEAATPAAALRRHQLVRLHARAWADILARDWDAVARACLGHWAAHGLPLVVTTQRPAVGAGAPAVWLGLPAPLRWQRRRLALQVPRAAIASTERFAPAADIAASLPAPGRAAFAALARDVAGSGADMRVFGSHGWQRLTGLDYVREGSDIDLCVDVASAAQADAVAGHLRAFAAEGLRLDGELMFAHGDAVHWREWADWRRGACSGLLIKRIDGPVMADGLPGEAAFA